MKRLTNWSLTAKVLGSYALVAAFALALGVLGYRATLDMNQVASGFYDRYLVLQHDRDALHITIKDGGRTLREHLLETTAENKDKKRQAIYGYRDEVREKAKKVRAMLSPAQQRTWDQFSTDMDAYYVLIENAMALSDQGKQKEAYTYIAKVARPNYTKSMDAFKAVDEGLMKEAEAAKKRADSTTQSLLLALILGSAAVVAVTLFIATLNARGVKRPVAELVTRLESLADQEIESLSQGLSALAEGDLTHPVGGDTPAIAVTSQEEFGQLATAFNRMQTQLKSAQGSYDLARRSLSTVLADVAQGSRRVGETAQTLDAATRDTVRQAARVDAILKETMDALVNAAQGSSEVAEGSDHLARDAGVAAQSMDELQREVSLVDEASAEQAAATLEVRDSLIAVAKTLGESTQSLGRLKVTVGEASTAIGALGDRQGEIAGMVSTIQTVAEQTNLLALNAAIEAARAGEQGRGFAVVAEEVRKLAEQASQATNQITTVINEIRAGIEASRTAMTASTSAVDFASQTSSQGQATLEVLTQAAERIAELAESNRSKIQSVSSSARQVANAIESVASVSQEAAASAQTLGAANQQIAASAQELARESEAQTGQSESLHRQATDLAEVTAEVDAQIAKFHLDGATQLRVA